MTKEYFMLSSEIKECDSFKCIFYSKYCLTKLNSFEVLTDLYIKLHARPQGCQIWAQSG